MSKTLSVAAALALAGCATTPAAPAARSAPASLAPVPGCYRIVGVPTTPTSVQVGSRLCFAGDEVAIFNDETNWARMNVDWEPQTGPTLAARHRGMELRMVLSPTAGGGLQISEDGAELGTAVRLSGADEAAFVAILGTLPTVAVLREQARACFAAYHAALPDEQRLDVKDPAQIHTTASFVGLLALAQDRLLTRCLPVPPPCVIRPLGPVDRRQARRDACAARETPVP